MIGNDVHLAALSEKEELTNQEIPFFYLFLSEGVGGTFIEDGHLIKGHNQFAGEVGLIKLESGKTVEEQINWLSFIKRMGYRTDEKEQNICNDILRRLNDGDKEVKKEIEQTTDIIARILSYTVCLLNPGVISIGGKYHFLGEAFLNSIQSKLNKLLISKNSTDLILKFSISQGRGTILGTASHLNNLWLENLSL